ncbi:MAG: hypothetical protein KF861_02560 [Planctomycetaceae bacterium]|nr:hypothetical protein [Planctomycetaceae bacterium]
MATRRTLYTVLADNSSIHSPSGRPDVRADDLRNAWKMINGIERRGDYGRRLDETAQGKVFTGLLESRSDDEIVLRDAPNKPIRISSEDVELLALRQELLMPQFLRRDMTE